MKVSQADSSLSLIKRAREGASPVGFDGEAGRGPGPPASVVVSVEEA